MVRSLSYHVNIFYILGCQLIVLGHPNIHCSSCTSAGTGKCDRIGCTEYYTTWEGLVTGLVYNSATKACQKCQRSILSTLNHRGVYKDVNCASCGMNGAGTNCVLCDARITGTFQSNCKSGYSYSR